jgi:hypothetical protein
MIPSLNQLFLGFDFDNKWPRQKLKGNLPERVSVKERAKRNRREADF